MGALTLKDMHAKIGDFDDAIVGEADLEGRLLSNFNNKPQESSCDIEKMETDYEKYGISDVIDLAIWEALDGPTQGNIRAYVLHKARPEGIDSDLWAELSPEDKSKILRCKIIKMEIEQPDEIDPATWVKLNISTQSAIISKMFNMRPPGFDVNLWDGLNDLTKRHITDDLRNHKCNTKSMREVEYKTACRFLPWHLYEFITREVTKRWKAAEKKNSYRWWMQRLTLNSRVLTFFFSGVHVIEDPDSGIGAMVLVCALILTIPFGVFSFINDSWFTSLRNALSNCSSGLSYSHQTYGVIHSSITKSLSACVYFSMMGLIISSVYYVFKPLPGKEMDRWCRSQGRVLIACLFSCTACSVAGLMALGLYLLEYSAIQFADVCTYDVNKLYVPGIIGLVVSFGVSIMCMW